MEKVMPELHDTSSVQLTGSSELSATKLPISSSSSPKASTLDPPEHTPVAPMDVSNEVAKKDIPENIVDINTKKNGDCGSIDNDDATMIDDDEGSEMVDEEKKIKKTLPLNALQCFDSSLGVLTSKFINLLKVGFDPFDV